VLNNMLGLLAGDERPVVDPAYDHRAVLDEVIQTVVDGFSTQ